MSALFDFKAFLTVVILTICTCTYVKSKFPSLLNDRTGFRGLFWKAARIGDALHTLNANIVPCLYTPEQLPAAAGERLSPWVAVSCIVMGLTTLFV